MNPAPADSDDPRTWQAALAAVQTVLELPPAERDAALGRLPLESGVRRLAERLLRSHARQGVLDQPLNPARDGREAVADLSGRRLGRWLLTAPLGQGGMSVVYRARSLEPPVGQEAALKLLSLAAATPAGRARFEREIDILVRLRHPGIAPVHDAGTAPDGTPWFAMALVEGVDIETWCNRRGLDTPARVDAFLQVCDAVEHAHRHLVIHRDIKPGNVMVGDDGRVVLLDFGISRLIEQGADEAAGTGTYAFTPRHAAPEQLHGGAITTATDVYSLGSLLHTLLIGASPQPAGDGSGAECRHPAAMVDRRDKPAVHRLLRGDLGAIIRKAISQDPTRRYPGAAELVADLRAWQQSRPVAARQGGRRYRARRFVARHRLACALVAALATSLVAGVIGFAWQAQRAVEQAAAAMEAEQAATLAKARAEQARERAESLNRFILDLFDANLPSRPREELPTTAELLELGVARARDPSSGPPAMRAQMLTAIGRIHGLRADRPLSVALAEEAIELARGDLGDDGDVLARALMLRAQMHVGETEHAHARELLAEALAATLPGHGPAPLVHLEVRRAHAALLSDGQQWEASVRALEDLLREAGARSDVPDAFIDGVRAAMAVDYVMLRRHEPAQAAYEALLAARARNRESDLFTYTVTLSNSANNLISLGHFTEAGRRIEQAIENYGRLLDSPNSYRASARMIRGNLRLRQGLIEEALVEIDAASLELALSYASDPEDSPFPPYFRIAPLVAGERWPDVERAAGSARQRLLETAAHQRERLVYVEAWLAHTQCRRGDEGSGSVLLESADSRARAAPLHDMTILAAIEEARAHCLAARGELHAAITALHEAADFDARYPPGEVFDLARRSAQRGHWLEAVGDPARAALARSQSQAHLEALALPQGRPWTGSIAYGNR